MKEKYVKPLLMKVDLEEELIMASGPLPCVDVIPPCADVSPCDWPPCSGVGPCETFDPCSTD